ncbi:MAG: hypothetical protein AAGF89_10050 [Bacteroidota bacterium]
MRPLFYLTLLLGSTTLYAQTFQQELGQALGQFAQAQSPEQLSRSVEVFSKLSESEGATWHANYYAAFATIVQSFRTEDVKERDRLVDEAQSALDVAISAGADETEATALQARLNQARISINPVRRSMLYGPNTLGMLFPAKAKAPNNPRILLLLAQTVERTPAMYGGGPEKALGLARASVEAFKNWTSNDPFAPQWGADEATTLLHRLDTTVAKTKKK